MDLTDDKNYVEFKDYRVYIPEPIVPKPKFTRKLVVDEEKNKVVLAEAESLFPMDLTNEEGSEFDAGVQVPPVPEPIVYKPVFTLKLLVDKEKDKVVLAEAGKDFVDLLFRFMALPMGTIVRLVEKYHQRNTTPIGCFNNLYRSVRDMDKDDFLIEACRDMLLSLGSVKFSSLNINDNTEVRKYHRCSIWDDQSCACSEVVYSVSHRNYSFRCSCGRWMQNFDVPDDSPEGYCDEIFVKGCDEIFVSQKTSFLITDNMEVEFASIALTAKTLRRLGYQNLDKLSEKVVDVYHEEVLLYLLHCLFLSKTPLTDVFMKKPKSFGMPSWPGLLKKHSSFGMPRWPGGFETEPTKVVSLKVLGAESEQDFVDLLFSFLVVPLESFWGLTGRNTEMGCIDNFCESLKSLSSSGNTKESTYTCMFPWQYKFQKSLLGVCYNRIKSSANHECDDSEPVYPNNEESGLVKRGATYMISDDLTIAAVNSSSTISFMKKWNVELDDIEEHVIKVGEKEAMGLVKASLMTSTALTTALEDLLFKEIEE